MGPLIALLAALALATPPAHAAPVAEATLQSPTARTSSGIELVAEVRADHLHGRPILVTVVARNPTATPRTFPDLASRPHLVRFEVTAPGARPQVRYTTPPAQDGDTRWTLAPRGERRVLLEIPSSGAIKSDTLDLRVRVLDGDETLELGPIPLRLSWPSPVEAHLVPDLVASEGTGWMSPWIQRTSSGADLYLDARASLDPDRSGDPWFLVHLDAPVRPFLAASRPTEAWARHVYWRHAERGIGFVRLASAGSGVRHAPRRVDLPWPEWDLLATGVTDPQGGLHVPIWIPAPSGAGGEVRVVSIDPQGTPYFRGVVKTSAQPRAWTAADAAGQMRLLLLLDGNLDLYTLSTAPGATLPAFGERLLPPRVRKAPSQPAVADDGADVAPAGSPAAPAAAPTAAPALPPLPPVAGARFGILPDTPEQPGGLAVFAWSDVPGEKRLLSGAWLSLQGREIARVDGVSMPGSLAVRDVLPRGYDALAVVATDPSGAASLLAGDLRTAIPLPDLAATEVVRLDTAGRILRVATKPRVGITVRRVDLPTP